MSRHKIEEAVKVYLRLNEAGDAWEVDPVVFDGDPLDGYDYGPINEDCGCGQRDKCAVARAAAREVPLPNAGILLRLLNEAAARPRR